MQDKEVRAALARLQRASADLSPAMAAIATELLSLTEGAFLREGPGWAELAPSTRKSRARTGKWPGQILPSGFSICISAGERIGAPARSGPRRPPRPIA